MSYLITANNRLPYNPKLKDRARDLRKNMTESEKKLWYDFLRPLSQKTPPQSPSSEGEETLASLRWGRWLSESEIGGSKLRIYKQRPIDNFIVDFYIPKYKLVIEVDWESHFDIQWKAYDMERTNILEWLWLEVIRFTNIEVMQKFDSVCEGILKKIISWK